MVMLMSRWPIVIAALVCLGAGEAQDAIVRARQLYNRGQYDAAIAAAIDARRRPEQADAAGVVLARAYLERYRQGTVAADLGAAREILKAIEPGRLIPRDRGEWVVGLGELLYFDGEYGAAAELFDAAMGYVGTSDAESRERVTYWWALAVDRQAQAAEDGRRRSLYKRLLDRMESILRSEPSSAAASYWLAVGAAGTDDLDRAWDAAVAAWVRASATGKAGDSLRDDLDRFVQQWILPERARRPPGAEGSKRAAALRAEWRALTQAWPRR
jgi:hypothetical protein